MIVSIISIIISILGAFLGTASFYLTQIKKPRIIAIGAERVRMGYTSGGGFQIYLPITFINTSQQTGIVRKMNLIIYQVNEDKRVFCMELSRFSMLNDENILVDKSFPYPIAITGKSSVNELLRFVWWDVSRPRLVLGNSEYKLVLNIWTSKNENPDISILNKFTLKSTIFTTIEESRLNGKSISVEVELNETKPKNRILDNDESLKLNIS